MKQNYYFTFGLDSIFRHKVVKITAADSECASELMLSAFGNKWAFQYDEYEWKNNKYKDTYDIVPYETLGIKGEAHL